MGLSQAASIQETDFSNETDADLLMLISWQKEDSEGARRAWGEFYLRHFDFLSAWCLKWLGHRRSAEVIKDLVNDTFLRVFTHGADTFRSEETDRDDVRKQVRSWLCRIAKNQFLMQLRANKNVTEVAFEDSEHSNPEPIQLTPQRKAQCEQLRETLENLSEREYDILMARFSNYHRTDGKQQFDPEILADLAERWQVTKDYVRQILYRTLQRIKAQNS